MVILTENSSLNIGATSDNEPVNNKQRVGILVIVKNQCSFGESLKLKAWMRRMFELYRYQFLAR